MESRLWVISQLYYPEETSTAYFLTKIAEGLAADHEVHALCGQPGYAKRGTRAPRTETRNGVQIVRCASTTWDKNVLLFKLVNFATISVSIFVNALMRLRRSDVALVVTNPPTLPFLIRIACWVRGARCVILVHDVYPEVLAAVGKMKTSNLLYRMTSALTKRLYAGAERIVVLGRDMAALARRKLESRMDKVVVIPNWADIDEVTPDDAQRNAFLEPRGLSGKFVVQYAGNMGYPNDLESLLEAARLLRDRTDVHFLMIGGGAKRSWVERFIQEHTLSNVTMVGNLPRDQQALFLNGCDLAVVSLVAGMAGVGVPSRTYNILAAGKPILAICEAEAEAALVVREEQIGWVVEPHAPQQVVEAICAAKDQPEAREAMAIRARDAAVSQYAFPIVIAMYQELMQTLLTARVRRPEVSRV